jgi:hypothetical protein
MHFYPRTNLARAKSSEKGENKIRIRLN